jgi:hypothetical protein
MNRDEHFKNRSAFPPSELAKHRHQHVAWSLDGTRILGGHADRTQLIASLQAAGYGPDDYVLAFVEGTADPAESPRKEDVWEKEE